MISTGNINVQEMTKRIAQAYTDEDYFFETTSGITPPA